MSSFLIADIPPTKGKIIDRVTETRRWTNQVLSGIASIIALSAPIALYGTRDSNDALDVGLHNKIWLGVTAGFGILAFIQTRLANRLDSIGTHCIQGASSKEGMSAVDIELTLKKAKYILHAYAELEQLLYVATIFTVAISSIVCAKHNGSPDLFSTSDLGLAFNLRGGSIFFRDHR